MEPEDTLCFLPRVVAALQVVVTACRSQQAVSDAAAQNLGRALELAAEERRLAQDQAKSLEAKLLGAQVRGRKVLTWCALGVCLLADCSSLAGNTGDHTLDTCPACACRDTCPRSKRWLDWNRR